MIFGFKLNRSKFAHGVRLQKESHGLELLDFIELLASPAITLPGVVACNVGGMNTVHCRSTGRGIMNHKDPPICSFSRGLENDFTLFSQLILAHLSCSSVKHV